MLATCNEQEKPKSVNQIYFILELKTKGLILKLINIIIFAAMVGSALKSY